MLLRCWIFVGIAAIAPAQTFTTLASFNLNNGAQPSGSLVQGADGNFYGTTYDGGANGVGTVFKITLSGTLTTLYSFGGADDAVGTSPDAGLVQASDGNFYGTTSEGGAGLGGGVFKITPGGTLTTLYSFTRSADGEHPEAALIQATDGNFYGTTSGSGVNTTAPAGTVFKITPQGVLTTLYTFSGADGSQPNALVQAADGNLYGTTSGGGANGLGTVFKITPGGTLTMLYSFTGHADGSKPYAGLIQGTDGNFYGTASGGGANGAGTLFKTTPAGTLTILYSFAITEAAFTPEPGLIQATDGNFYGANSGAAMIFKVTPGGTLTRLYTFGVTGNVGGLTEGVDGNLYGTTAQGGAGEHGSVFELQVGLPSASSIPAITLVQNAEGGGATIAPNTWVTLKGSNLAPAGDSRIWQASDFVNNLLPTQLDGVGVTLNGEKAFVYYISPTQINILTPPDLKAGPVQAQVTTSAGTSASAAAQAQTESPSFFIIGAGPYVVATHADGSLVGPASLYPGQTTPAQPGETIVLYANGFGAVSPAVVSGSETQSGSLNPLPVITIGGTAATVQFAGLISPGLFQFNVVVPASTPAGDNALTASYGGLTTQSGVLVTVGQ